MDTLLLFDWTCKIPWEPYQFRMIFPCPWAPYIATICIISGIAEYLVHNNLSLLLDCQLLIFPMGHAIGQGTFFHSLRFQNGCFFEVSKSQKKKQPKKTRNLKDKYI